MVLQLELGSILSIQKFGMVHESLPVEKKHAMFPLYAKSNSYYMPST